MKKIPAVLMRGHLGEEIGSHHELLGHKGWYTRYVTSNALGKRATDVCCPGCGDETYHLHPDRYPLTGEDERLSTVDPITFACCNQTWELKSGTWQKVGRLRKLWRWAWDEPGDTE